MNRRRLPVKLRIPQPGQLRVGIYITAIHCGGVERWAASLASEFSAVKFVGFCSRYPGAGDGWMPGRLYGIDEIGDFFDACDVILSWFFAPEDVWLLSQFNGPLYCVSHGSFEHQWFRDQARYMLGVPNIRPVGVSQAAAKAFGLPEGEVPVIYNGVELDRSISEKDPDLKKQMGFGDKQVILYYGRMSSEKRPHLAADMMKYLDPDKYAVVLCGSNTSFVHTIERRPGVYLYRPTRNPRSLFSIADMTVNFSQTESFCLSLFEALASGVTSVTSEWEVTQELEGLLGEPLLTTPLHADADQLAATVSYHLARPDQERDLRLQRVVLNRLSTGYMVRQWERLLGVNPLEEFVPYDEATPHDPASY